MMSGSSEESCWSIHFYVGRRGSCCVTSFLIFQSGAVGLGTPHEQLLHSAIVTAREATHHSVTMSRRQCLLTTRTALYRVFVSPLERPDPARHQLSLLLTQHVSPSSYATTAASIRCFNNAAKLNNRRPPRPNANPAARGGGSDADSKFIDEDLGYDRRYTTKESWERSGRDRLPRDHEITDPQIMVLDNGTIEGPLATRYVLTKIAPEESLRMFQPYRPAKDGKPAEYGVCKIVDKKKEHEKNKEVREKKKENGGTGKPKTKEMELSWGIGDHDLMTKLRHLAGFVEKGMKVEIVLGKKRKGKKTSEEEAKAVVDKVREEIERCGGKEGKPASGDVGGTYRLFVVKK